MNLSIRITLLAVASTLAWTAAAADPAAGSSQTSSASPAPPTPPPAAASSSPGGTTGSLTATQPEKPPPMPLHEIEGNGGVFSTLSAYLVNPPRNGEAVGRPSVGFGYIALGYGRDLLALTITETPWERLELGFGYDYLNLGDLPTAIAAQTKGATRVDDNLALYNANARLEIVKEGEFDQKWMPALTAGVHYKYNDGFNTINDEIGGGMHVMGLTSHQGVDYTLYASKMFTCLPRPVLVNLGGRATKSAEIGLLGFTHHYSFNFEGSIVALLTDRFMVAGEYKEQPADFTANSLLGRPDHWWTADAGYIINPHMTVAIGYGHFGTVANHQANGVWGITTKWEF